MTHPKILVAFDFSNASKLALQHAQNLTRALQAELVLVFVLELPIPPPGQPGFLPAHVVNAKTNHARALFDAQLGVVQSEVRARGCFEVGPAREVLLRVIAEEAPVLVVVGTHGRRGVARFFLGSVAEHLMRTSPVPVLVVPPCSTQPPSQAGSGA